MNLPFLKKTKSDAGIATVYRAPDENSAKDSEDSDDLSALKACASDLIDAIHANDKDKVAEVLKNAFEICDSMPHEEGPHTNE